MAVNGMEHIDIDVSNYPHDINDTGSLIPMKLHISLLSTKVTYLGRRKELNAIIKRINQSNDKQNAWVIWTNNFNQFKLTL